MYNFSSFITGTIKILNIVNKSLPLLKDLSSSSKSANSFVRKNLLNNKKIVPRGTIKNNTLSFFR